MDVFMTLFVLMLSSMYVYMCLNSLNCTSKTQELVQVQFWSGSWDPTSTMAKKIQNIIEAIL